MNKPSEKPPAQSASSEDKKENRPIESAPVSSTPHSGESVLICVRNAYPRRGELSDEGYGFRWQDSAWTKNVPIGNVAAEEKKLTDRGFVDYSVGDRDMSKEPMATITVSGRTFPYIDSLKHHGFSFNRKTKTWSRKVLEPKVKETMESLRDVPEFEALGFRAFSPET